MASNWFGPAAVGARARQLHRSVISVSYRCVSPRLSRPDNSPGGRQRLMTTSRGPTSHGTRLRGKPVEAGQYMPLEVVIKR